MDSRTQLTNAFQTFLGRAPEAGQIDWRLGQRTSIPNQINEIRNSAEARAFSSRNQAPAAPAQPSQVDTLTSQLGTMDSNAQNPVDVYNAALEKLGISDARTRVTAMRQALIDNQNLLAALPGNVQQRTSNSVVTEAQRQRLVASEGAPISNQGNQINQQLGTAQADQADILNQGKTQTDLTLQGQSTQRQALLDRLKLAIDSSNNVEQKRRWQAEYDRQIAQDRQSQANADRTFQAAQAKASSGGSGGSSKTKESKVSVQSLFEGYNPKTDKNYTENVVIPELVKQLGFSQAKAAQVAYDYRKAVFKE